MELPIILKFEENLLSLRDQKVREKVRILDLDGVYLVSIWDIEDQTGKLLSYFEKAFDALYEAEEFLYDELDIEFPSVIEERKEWI